MNRSARRSAAEASRPEHHGRSGVCPGLALGLALSSGLVLVALVSSPAVAEDHRLIVWQLGTDGHPGRRLGPDEAFHVLLNDRGESLVAFLVQVVDEQGRPAAGVRYRTRLGGRLAGSLLGSGGLRPSRETAAAPPARGPGANEQSARIDGDQPWIVKWWLPAATDESFLETVKASRASTTDLVFDFAARIAPAADGAEPTDLAQTNGAAASLWTPIISALYVHERPDPPETVDGTPDFPEIMENSIKPLPHFRDLGRPPNLNADWRKLQAKLDKDSPPSAWVVSDRFAANRTKRLVLHDNQEEEAIVAYSTRERVMVVFNLDLTTHNFTLDGERMREICPDLESSAPAERERECVLRHIRIIPEETLLSFHRIDGADRLGAGGREETGPGGQRVMPRVDPMHAAVGADTIWGTQKGAAMWRSLEFIPRAPSVPRGSGLDQILEIRLKVTLEADPELRGPGAEPAVQAASGQPATRDGEAAPTGERKTIEGRIRIDLRDKTFEVNRLGYERQRED